MTAALMLAALAVGYVAGRHRLPSRAVDVVQDWADRRTSRAARLAVQPIYALLISALFVSNPARFVRNLRANRRHQDIQFTGAMKARAPQLDPDWHTRTGADQ